LLPSDRPPSKGDGGATARDRGAPRLPPAGRPAPPLRRGRQRRARARCLPHLFRRGRARPRLLVPDCGERTIEEQASASGWRLHPRIEEALLRHPRSYVISDSIPDGFLHVAGDSEISVEIDAHTGRVYRIGGWGWLPDRPPDAPLGSFELFSIELYAPSLGEWFARWIDDTWHGGPHAFELLPEMVDTSGQPDPETVWRELYRFGPDFALRPDDADDNAGDDWGDDWGDG
jgi:hypothetical protein